MFRDNQNIGNKIKARPSVKIHAPIGGKSSFSLGWTAPEVETAPKPRMTMDAYRPDPTPVYSAPSMAPLPSRSAAMAAPAPVDRDHVPYGGIGAGCYAAVKPASAAPIISYSAAAPSYSAPAAAAPSYAAPAAPSYAAAAPSYSAAPAAPSSGLYGVSSNAFASGAQQNCGNFLTDRRTTRVLGPPGGATSFRLG